ncbi:hypothetical protein Emag_005048 [Eimeria magna]
MGILTDADDLTLFSMWNHVGACTFLGRDPGAGMGWQLHWTFVLSCRKVAVGEQSGRAGPAGAFLSVRWQHVSDTMLAIEQASACIAREVGEDGAVAPVGVEGVFQAACECDFSISASSAALKEGRRYEACCIRVDVLAFVADSVNVHGQSA